MKQRILRCRQRYLGLSEGGRQQEEEEEVAKQLKVTHSARVCWAPARAQTQRGSCSRGPPSISPTWPWARFLH